jgi:hypothetical protein
MSARGRDRRLRPKTALSDGHAACGAGVRKAAMKIAAQASALSGLGIGFEDDAIAEAFETALEVCVGSGREVAAKGDGRPWAAR